METLVGEIVIYRKGEFSRPAIVTRVRENGLDMVVFDSLIGMTAQLVHNVPRGASSGHEGHYWEERR